MSKLKSAKCGFSKKSRVRVCISPHKIPGMGCGKNPRTGLYACANGKVGKSVKTAKPKHRKKSKKR